MCQDALEAFVIMHRDSLETTVNSILMNVPFNQISLELYVWMVKTATTVTAQVVD